MQNQTSALLQGTLGFATLAALLMGTISGFPQETEGLPQFGPEAPARQAVRFSTYLGGAGYDNGSAVAIGSSGSVYTLGQTSSRDFPVRREVMGYQGGLAGLDAFVARYNASGDSLLYATFLGGARGDEVATAIAIDADERAVVVGGTGSSDFPAVGHLQAFRGGGVLDFDAFVAQIDTDGSTIRFATTLGGSGDETATGVALSGDDIFVAGTTTSSDFPTTAGSIQSIRIGGSDLGDTDAFVAKIANTSGGYRLEWATYLGGSGDEMPSAVMVDDAGGVWVVGTTASDDFPVSSASQVPLQSEFSGPYRQNEGDAFVVRLTPDGASLDVAAYLGGAQDDQATGITIDAQGRLFVTGWTESNTFPTTAGTYRDTPAGIRDRFVLRMSQQAGVWGLDYATRFGSESGYAMGRAGIVAEPSGDVWIAGAETALSLPVVGAVQPVPGGGSADGFLVRLNSDGTTVGYASYLGGTSADAITGLALKNGQLCVTGGTSSQDFPVSSAVQPVFDGPTATDLLTTSAFLTCFDTALIRTTNEQQPTAGAPLVVLHGSYPNPANRETTFRIVLAAPVHVTLRVFDILGRHQATVVDDELQPGTHDLHWDTSALPAGTYFYVAEGAGARAVRNMVVIR